MIGGGRPKPTPDSRGYFGKYGGTFVPETLMTPLEELEREYILKVLQYTSGQKKRASEILGINASTLYRKLQAYKAQGLIEVEGGLDHEDDEALDQAA